MPRTIFILLFCVFGGSVMYAQSESSHFLKPSDTLNKKRRNTIAFTEVGLASVALIGLDQLWYKDYPRSKFHTIDDNNEWLQMDKLGHVFSSYQIGRAGASILNWSGVSEKNQLIYGATLGFSFLTAVEILDGFSEEWGFSWGDMIGNASGVGLFVGQELLWQEQRITLKYSFHQTKYANQRPDKLGESFLQEVLKDYNGQTYWLSINLYAFIKNEKIPKWLNLAFGYGATGMLTGDDKDVVLQYLNQNRIRQYYISLDVDLSKINTKSRVLRTVFDVFNVIKVPFPALEFNGKNGIKGHAVYF